MNQEIKLYTTEETAKKLGITRQGLSYLIKAGKIKPADVEGKYKFFTEEAIKKYKERYGK